MTPAGFAGNYAEHLDQGEYWPQSAAGRVPIETMPPQYASAALAKLITWAARRPSGFLLSIDDVTAREETVRRSPLGRALASQAQLLSVDDAHALAHEHPVKIEALVIDLVDILLERTPLDAEDAARLAVTLAVTLNNRYTITVREDHT